MKIRIKTLLIVLGTILVIGISVFGAVRIIECKEAKRLAEQEEEEYMRMLIAYMDVNRVFLISSEPPYSAYLKATLTNKYDIIVPFYLVSKMYESQTGIILPHDTIIDYFSEEFEPDGSLRLYDNGLHPEIEAYVEWAKDRMSEIREYVNEIQYMYSIYFQDNRDKGFIYQYFYSLSPQMLDELIKKEADPDYEMDLLSLQQQGY